MLNGRVSEPNRVHLPANYLPEVVVRTPPGVRETFPFSVWGSFPIWGYHTDGTGFDIYTALQLTTCKPLYMFQSCSAKKLPVPFYTAYNSPFITPPPPPPKQTNKQNKTKPFIRTCTSPARALMWDFYNLLYIS